VSEIVSRSLYPTKESLGLLSALWKSKRERFPKMIFEEFRLAKYLYRAVE
jgi:hypothetical protein